MGDPLQYTVRLGDGREFGPAPREMVIDWAREGRVPLDATLVPSDGSPPVPVTSDPSLAAVLQAPPTVSTGVPAAAGGGYSGIVPYKNSAALIGYYTAIASLIPFVGILAGPAAIIFGVIGLRRVSAMPEIKGQVHGWIAIVLGTLGLLINGGCVASIVFGRM